MRALVRPPAVAGSFYPSDAGRLERDLRSMLAAARRAGPTPERPLGLVVPHAGYDYSGPVAASGYARIEPWAEAIARVALFGPAHFWPLEGAAASSASAWRTPLGEVELDEELRRLALDAGAALADEPHLPEHALEVQLPWLQVILGSDARVLPVAVGRSRAEDAASLLGAVADAADLVVVSTDLSHYLPIDRARERDRRTAEAILARDAAAIGSEDACGLFALRGAVELAERRGWAVELLDLRTSGDTAGDPRRVVGYGAFAFATAGR
jgi:hypothetical protein